MKKDLLDKLDNEIKQQINQLKLNPNPRLESIIKAWETVDKANYSNRLVLESQDQIYEYSYGALPEKQKAEDIQQFSLLLPNYQDTNDFGDKAGIFLSYLIGNSVDNYFELNTSQLSQNIDNLGYKIKGKKIYVSGDLGAEVGGNMISGKICVDGNVGAFLANEMMGGTILVKGNCDSMAGCCMLGGKVTVLGGAGDFLGASMEGGLVVVKGNVGEGIADFMRGGTLKIYNPFCSFGYDIYGGDIYYKNKLIIKDGERLRCR